MALAATAVFEVDLATGADTNAGAYNASRAGATTDYTYGASQVVFSYTDLASANGTTNPAIITSVLRPFVAADIGNHIRINSGTNWTVNLYEIVSVAAGAATLDKAVGSLAALTLGVGKVGGAVASPGAAGITTLVPGITIWIKKAAYLITSLTTNVAGGVLGTATGTVTTVQNVVMGYKTTRGDAPVQADCPTISPDSSAGTWNNSVMNLGKFTIAAYLNFTNPQALPANGFNAGVSTCLVYNCYADGFNSASKQGISIIGMMRECRVTNCTFGIRPIGASQIVDCSTQGCTTSLKLAGGTPQLTSECTRCIFDGGICEVIGGTDDSCSYYNCTLANGASWLENTSALSPPAVIKRCTQYGGSGYGADTSLVNPIVSVTYQDTAMGGNASGNFNPAITNARISNITTFTANPYVDAANATVANRNYALNVAAGGGALAKARSFAYAGTATTSYNDYGAVGSKPGTGGSSGGGTDIWIGI